MRTLLVLLALGALAAGLIVFMRSEQDSPGARRGPAAVEGPGAATEAGSSARGPARLELPDGTASSASRAADEGGGLRLLEDEASYAAGSESSLAGQIQLQMRLLNEDGTPVVLAAVELRLVSEHRTLEHVARTDGAGAVHLSPPDLWLAAESVSLLATLVVEAADRTTAAPVGRTVVGPLSPGANDLGELTLRVPSLIAAGRVVGPAGEPIEGARVELVTVARDLNSREVLRTQPARDVGAPATTTNTKGEFQLQAQTQRLFMDVEYAVVASSRAHLTSEPVSFEHGQGDLWITLASAGWIEGRIEIERAGPRPRHAFVVTVEARPSGQDELSATVRVRAPGAFELGGLAAGDYDLSFRSDDPFPALIVAGLAVSAGVATQDARLDPVRMGANTFELRILDEAGRDLAATAVIRRRPSGASGWPAVAGASRSGNTYKLTTSLASLDLRVEAEGYEPLEVVGVDGDRTLTLRRAPTVRVSVAAFVFGVLEPGDELIVSLVHPEAEGTPPRAVLSADAPAADVGITGAYAYRLKLSLRRRVSPSRSTQSPVSARAFEPLRFDASSGVFEPFLELVLDLEALRAVSESIPSGD